MATRFEKRVVLAVIVGVHAGAAWAAGEMAPPEVVWRATTMAADLPEQIQPGYTLFTIDGDAGTNDSLAIFRLREGVTIEEFAEGSDRIDQAFMEGGDVPTAINDALAIVEAFHAEVSADAGERRGRAHGRAVRPRVQAGRGGRLRALVPRVARGGAPGADPPTPDASVNFVDFALAIPADLAAGEQTWHVINRGAQIHHMVIFMLAEGATLENFMEFMEQGPPEGADAPDGIAAPADYVGIMSPVRRATTSSTSRPAATSPCAACPTTWATRPECHTSGSG